MRVHMCDFDNPKPQQINDPGELCSPTPSSFDLDAAVLPPAVEVDKNHNDLFRTFVENSPGMAFIYDVELNGKQTVVYNDPKLNRLIDIESDQPAHDSANLFDKASADELNTLRKAITLNHQINKILDFNHRLKLDEENYKWIRTVSKSLQLGSGTIRWHCQLFDITESKFAEQSGRESELRYHALYQSASDAIFLMTTDTFTDCNQKTLDIFECKLDEIIGHSPIDFSPEFQPDGSPSAPKAKEKILLAFSGKPQMFEWVHKKKSGTCFDAEISLNKVQLPTGPCLQAIVRVITKRKQAELALRESEEKFRTVMEKSNDAIYILADGRFDLINKRFTDLTGLEMEDIRKPAFSIQDNLTPESIEIIAQRERLRNKGIKLPGVYEFSFYHKSGNLYYVQASVSEIEYKNKTAFLGVLRDITRQKSMESHLQQMQKIESIGQLAGGIAHDFNNMLTPILGYSELALSDLDQTDPLYSDLKEIHGSASRASELTSQLLAFSRKQVLDVKTVNLNRLIENFKNILTRTIREDIDIRIDYNTTHDTVKVDVTQIEQILMNLLLNSQDAMKSGGIISVGTENVVLDQDYADCHNGALSGNYVMLIVSDTGCGISKETIDKIFEPFFTTKATGRGTGLGLSTVYGIVKQHGGNVWVYSELGKGTTFKIYLPLHEDELIIPTVSKTITKRYYGKGTIF
jgi:two-component system, cell cycle sensor histidine kinase and response regulator CckA